MNSQKFRRTFRVAAPLFTLLLVVGAVFSMLGLSGCGGERPAEDTFVAFRAAVNSGDYNRAFGMLNQNSQTRVKDASNLEQLCKNVPAIKQAFSGEARLREARLRNNGRETTAKIVIVNEEGKISSEVGNWSAFSADGKNWEIQWGFDSSIAEVEETPVEGE